MTATGEEAPAVLTEVADAVDLREGPEGVDRVVRALAGPGSRSNKDLSLAVGMPIPIVVSILNELRTRGLVEPTRPAALSERGRAVFDATGPDLYDPAEVDRILAAVETDLAADGGVNSRAPTADVTIDQSHSTIGTKVDRLRVLLERRVLPVERAILVGDDDLMSLTIALGAVHAGRRLVGTLTVVDSDPRVIDFVGSSIGELAGAHGEVVPAVDLVEHDLREPLPPLDPHDLAITDPPYTVPGATLFLARAVEALHPRLGARVMFSFGAKPADELHAVQSAITDAGLVIVEVERGANRYEGAGSIGSASDRYDLVVGVVAERAPGAEQGPIYTADLQVSRIRRYRCTSCGREVSVGDGGQYGDLDELRRAGCPDCSGDTFAPGSKIRDAR